MDQFSRGDLRFDVRDQGPADGEPVVLLHGFPQSSAAWEYVAPLLHEAGLRTLAPDLRGYSPGARPTQASAYRLDVMDGDVLALLDAAGLESAHVVGHDWGGALAWQLAAAHPDRVRTATVLSTPHPAAMQWATTHSTQLLRSWYMLAIQIPGLPEAVLQAGMRRRGLSSLGLPREQSREYADLLQQPGALRGALNWYRAVRTRPNALAAAEQQTVSVPVTYVWGERDPYLGRAAAERTAAYCFGPYRFIAADADHWLPEKHPELVASAVLDRITTGSSPAAG
ncbi:alpha/beta fold hydrolase [Epidermidibacterium keratini]|uniref:Alpha/beta fold hydrolase n=1 Tax=Epidermidibacterium keratini TaxID=1891644 RepID=A0A7L4YKK2_9ACTN|nr:alpha/beta fold hydrolase [Epidermidibacterium keratini]QHB99659.1 alpha/beta fold hydrolase [Epidermidibacterium keratini]